MVSGVELVGDEDIVRALLAACKGAIEPVLNTYEVLFNGAILPSPILRLRLLRSVLGLLREWAMSIIAQKMGTSAVGASLILGGPFSMGQATLKNQGVHDKISSAANRFVYLPRCTHLSILLSVLCFLKPMSLEISACTCSEFSSSNLVCNSSIIKITGI